MRKSTSLYSFLFLLTCLLFSVESLAQETTAPKPKASPPQTVTGKIGGTTVTVNYSSPAVKGRKIWGELTPYGKVWRAGANEATTIELDHDLEVEAQRLPAGKYSIFMIPGEEQWTVIFNKQTGHWGTRHDAAQDVLRVTTTPAKSASFNERLQYEVNSQGLVMRWENLEVPVSMISRKK